MPKAPKFFKGKEKVFEEVFTSPGNQPTKEDAEFVLNRTREQHPTSDGWVEFAGYVEPHPDDRGWRAVRHHAQYK